MNDRSVKASDWTDYRIEGFSIDPKHRHSSRYASLRFLREVMQNPRHIGAIAPTSRTLAESIVRTAGVPTASKIIELGSGAGAITEKIIQFKSPQARVFALEQNANLVSVLGERFPEIEVACSCISRLRECAEAADFEKIDCIISALPWTNFSEDLQQDAMAGVAELLKPNGVFTTIACFGLHLTPSGKRFRKLLNRIFSQVNTSPVAWRNLPPAFVYRCRI